MPSNTQAGLGTTMGQAIKAGSNTPGQFGSFMSFVQMGWQAADATLGPLVAYRAAKQERQLLSIKAELSDLQAKQYRNAYEDVLRAGNQAVAAITYQSGQAKSSARVSQAAAGIRVGARGTSAETLTAYDIARDMQVNQTLANAVTQAWGYRRMEAQAKMNTLAIQAARKSISPWAAAITKHLTSAMEMMESSPWTKMGGMFGGSAQGTGFAPGTMSGEGMP